MTTKLPKRVTCNGFTVTFLKNGKPEGSKTIRPSVLVGAKDDTKHAIQFVLDKKSGILIDWYAYAEEKGLL